MTSTTEAIDHAMAHIRTRLWSTATPEAIARGALSPSVWQAMRRVDQMDTAGDVAATVEACRAWYAAWRDWLKAQQQEAAA